MYALFEDAGKFLAGRILSEAETSAQIELDSGKRVKVKTAHILLSFDKPAPAELLGHARSIAQGIELPLAWEFAPEDEFGFAELARDYFSAQAPVTEQAAMLLALYEAPHYFRRAGKGRFKKASAEVLQQALAAIEKKKQLQAQIDGWAAALAAGECPAPIREQLYKILFRPDKNAPEYKAVVEASRSAQRAPLELLQAAGAIDSSYQFYWKRFLFEHFPKGVGFPPLQAPEPPQDLPLAPVQAFSIDDSQTTEIDDALSLTGLGTGEVVLGIHIAAPGLALTPRPYLALAQACELSEAEVLATLAHWQAIGALRRFGLVLRHHELGYRANVMCVWQIPPAARDAIGAQLAQDPAVTLCYARPARPPHWPYTLFAMVHGKSRAEVDAAIDRLIAQHALAAWPHARLYTLHRYAQRGPHYA